MYHRNVILRYLDNPTRIAFWTVDEIATLFLPVSIGCIFGFPVTGFILSVVLYFSLKHFKQSFGLKALRHGMYWYLPGIHKAMKVQIKSHIREYIG